MQERRKRRLDEACRRLGLRNISYDGKSLVGKNMLVNNEQKYIYCVVGKVASSTWKQVIRI